MDSNKKGMSVVTSILVSLIVAVLVFLLCMIIKLVFHMQATIGANIISVIQYVAPILCVFFLPVVLYLVTNKKN